MIKTQILDLDRLIYLANFLTDVNWNQVCEERSCDSLCGWPLCGSSTEWTNSKPAIVIEPNSKNQVQILDRTELYWYCGQGHMELSKQVAASLNEEPWWLRASRSRPLDLEWLRIVCFDFDSADLTEESSMQVDQPSTSSSAITQAQISESDLRSLTTGIAQLSNFIITESTVHEESYTYVDSSKGIGIDRPPSQMSTDPLMPSSMLLSQLDELEPFNYTSARSTPSQDLIDSQSQSQEAMQMQGMDFSDSDTEEDGDTENFFNSTFSKQNIKVEMTPNLQIMNMMLHWVTWKSQKFCSMPDYKPHLHVVSMHVAAQHEDQYASNENETEGEGTRILPMIDGVDVEMKKRNVISQFLSSRLASICNTIKTIDKSSVWKSIDTLLTTFDFSTPVEGLKTAQWSTVAFALLHALSPRHPGLEDTLLQNKSAIESTFNVDTSFVKELQGMFKHHG
jgi:hypothetical protein